MINFDRMQRQFEESKHYSCGESQADRLANWNVWKDAWKAGLASQAQQNHIERVLTMVQSQAQQPTDSKVIELLKAAVKEIRRNTCSHEETHRGGVIWEICDMCGCKWADDEGGKPEFVEAKIITDIQSFLLQSQPQQPEKPFIYISKDEFDWRSKSGDLNGCRSLTCITPQHFGETHYGHFTVPLYLQSQAQQTQSRYTAEWKHSCAALLTDGVELWVDRCPHCGKPAPIPPAPEGE